MTKVQAIQRLKEAGLRITGARTDILMLLASAKVPLSHTEVIGQLPETECNPATVYRNLVKFRDCGIVAVVSRAAGIDRYALNTTTGLVHDHPHFICDDCGQVACLPFEVASSLKAGERWAASVNTAVIQLRGECPDCIDDVAESLTQK